MTDKDYFETKQHVQRNRIQAVDVAILIARLTLKDKDSPINHIMFTMYHIGFALEDLLDVEHDFLQHCIKMIKGKEREYTVISNKVEHWL